MLVEMHLLQNFAPSNLNRDDTGSPKNCDFGGYRRARISSQCQKRAIRTYVRQNNLLPAENLAVRTKRVAEEIIVRLRSSDRTDEACAAAVQSLLQAVKIAVDADRKTQYLLFLGNDQVAGIADLCAMHWDQLTAVQPTASPEQSARKVKASAKAAVPAEIRAAVDAVLRHGKAADLALFGRMLADDSSLNVDAASQVAHALSVNKVVTAEFDYFTAVDDLKTRDEDSGAEMIDNVEFNSACFYRYLNVDTGQLVRNLDGDGTLARQTVHAYLQAAIAAVPSGKQNSFAAHQRPSLIFATCRTGPALSLANAFLKPVTPRGDLDLMANAIHAIDHHWQETTEMYGADGLTHRAVSVLSGYEEMLDALRGAVVRPASRLVDETVDAAFQA